MLLRFRSLFASLAVGAFLVTVVATSYPVFLSASENELLGAAIADATVTRYGMGVAYRSTDVSLTRPSPDGSGTLWQRRGEVFTELAAESEALAPTERAIFGGVVEVTDSGGAPPPTGLVEGRLFAGTDAIDHVEIRSGAEGPGVWLPDNVSRPLGVGAGDAVILRSPDGEVRVAVDGVYSALSSQPRQGYWRLWSDDIYPCPELTCTLPPQFILADLDRLLELSTDLGQREATFAWQAPTRADPPLTLDAASELAGFSERLVERMSEGGDLFGLFRCCGERFTRRGTADVLVTGNAGLVVQEVQQRAAAVQGPMLVLLVTGLAIAFAVVAAAGIFSVVGRRVEMGVLTIRGWGPLAFGAKSSLEAVLPCVIGCIVGAAAAFVLIVRFGPAASASTSARTAALIAAAVATTTAVAIVGVVSGAAFVARHEHRHRVIGALALVPWELAAFAGAWVLAGRIAEGGVVVSGGVERPQPAVFLFPVLLSLGAGILLARLARLTLRYAVRDRGSGATAGWLAVRRLRGGPALTSLLLVAGVLTLSVSTASLATVASLRATVDAKARIFVGSQVQVQVVRDAMPAPGFPFPLTRATRLREAGTLDGGEAEYDLLAVESATLASAAIWNDAFSDEPLGTMLGRLDAPATDAIPVIVANGAGVRPRSVSLGQEDVPVTVVGTASTFPGTSSADRPLLVMERAVLAETFSGLPDPLAAPRATTELWIDGPADQVLERLDELDVRPLLVNTAEEVQDIPFIDAAVQTFLVLQVLGSCAVALLVVVAVVYLHSKQRSRVVATTLSARMGMARSTMRAASVVELGSVLLVSSAVGALSGMVAAAVVVPSLDPLPSIPPTPLVVAPIVATLVTTACLAVAAWLGGTIADRGARRVSTAEVMRVAE